jgi:hypothetical protein
LHENHIGVGDLYGLPHSIRLSCFNCLGSVYPIGKLGDKIKALHIPDGYKIEQFSAFQPPNPKKIAIKWDDEWHMTYEVFSDLGLAELRSGC